MFFFFSSFNFSIISLIVISIEIFFFISLSFSMFFFFSSFNFSIISLIVISYSSFFFLISSNSIFLSSKSFLQFSYISLFFTTFVFSIRCVTNIPTLFFTSGSNSLCSLLSLTTFCLKPIKNFWNIS